MELTPYMQRYFDEIGGLWQRRTSELAQDAVALLFPLWGSTIGPETVAAADAFLADDTLAPALRRLVSERRAGVARAMHCREVDAAASPTALED